MPCIEHVTYQYSVNSYIFFLKFVIFCMTHEIAICYMLYDKKAIALEPTDSACCWPNPLFLFFPANQRAESDYDSDAIRFLCNCPPDFE